MYHVGPISSMEQHLPMRMSMLGNGPPPGSSSGHPPPPPPPLAMEECSTTTPAQVSEASRGIWSPSQMLSTGSHAGVDDETRNLLPPLHRKERSELDLPLSGKSD